MNAYSALNWPSDQPHPTASEILANHDVTGKVVVITGASGGIGLATARALAKAGAEVIIGSRPGQKFNDAIAELCAASTNKIHAFPLDLANLDSVDSFAAAIIALGKPIDYLINNAGIIGPKALSSDGIEMGFKTNVIGHAVLTSALAPHLGDGARIACVSSFGHHFSPVVFDDINFENRPYSAWMSYGQSKTGINLMAIKLSQALASRGIDAFSLHPGAIPTDMTRDMVPEDFQEMAKQAGSVRPSEKLTLEQGAATSIWAVTEPQLAGHGGLYLQRCAIAEVIDTPNYREGVMRYATSAEDAERLWETIRTMTARPLPL